MNIDPNKLNITNNSGDQRFEAHIGDQHAYIDYRRSGDQVTFLHTDVPPAIEGQGIGSALVRTALENAKAEQLEVVPLCPFVRGYIRKHPEYLLLVSKNYRGGGL